MSNYISGNQIETDANQRLCMSAGIQSSWQYRKYITDHADAIRAHNLRDAGFSMVGDSFNPASTALFSSGDQPLNSCCPAKVTWQTHTPYLYTSIADRQVIPGVTTAPHHPLNPTRDQFISNMDSWDKSIKNPPTVRSIDNVRKLLHGNK